MKSMKKIMAHIDFLLEKSNTQNGHTITGPMDENERHALTDLVLSGMVRYVQTNPHIIIKRIA